jgi:hypothetical protein
MLSGTGTVATLEFLANRSLVLHTPQHIRLQSLDPSHPG